MSFFCFFSRDSYHVKLLSLVVTYIPYTMINWLNDLLFGMTKELN